MYVGIDPVCFLAGRRRKAPLAKSPLLNQGSLLFSRFIYFSGLVTVGLLSQL